MAEEITGTLAPFPFTPLISYPEPHLVDSQKVDHRAGAFLLNGWSSQPGNLWGDEPAWVYEITWEWEPLPGQRYPGDPGRRKAVHTPVYEASPPEEPAPR